MRVLAVTPAYPPHSMVGAWQATHLFLRHLCGLGHDVNAFAYLSRVRAWDHEGVHVETQLRGRSHAHRLARDVDLVISHAGDNGFGAEVAARAGVPSVRMVHGAMTNAGRADLFVFNSFSLLRATRHDGPAVVCHPPIDPIDWQVDRTGADRVTLIGCSDNKGIGTLTAVARTQPARRFVAVKGGYGRQHSPSLHNVTVLPSRPDLRPVYAATRVLLMPSAIETWGMTGVEAMSSGIPVIAHPTAGLRESLGDAGIFVDRDDTAGWCDALDRLDDPDAYAAASARALTRAAELDPQVSLDRFTAAVAQLVPVAA